MIEFDNIEKRIASLSTYYIELGVYEDGPARKFTTLASSKLGITNAELMFIHENGSPLRGIPARPVLQMTIDYVKKEWLTKEIDKALDIFITNDFDVKAYEQELERFCMRIQSYARKIIYSNDGRLVPNSPAVAKKKKGNHPLFDTGQLARSIVCRLIKPDDIKTID